MKNMRWVFIAGAGLAIISLVMLIDWISQPPASDPGPGPRVDENTVRTSINGNLGAVACDFLKSGGSAEPNWVFLKDGPDTTIVDSGANTHLFDFGSPQTTDAHDRLVLPEEPPTELRTQRSGSALLLCDKQRLGVVIIRQYCIATDPSSPWNNQVEEIDFPKYGEVWLSDDLYAGVKDPNAFAPPPELLQELRKSYTAFVIQDVWKARRFSEVLPASDHATLDCRKDFDGVEKFD